MTVESKQRREDFIDLPCINKNRQKERNIEKGQTKSKKKRKHHHGKKDLKGQTNITYYSLEFFPIIQK